MTKKPKCRFCGVEYKKMFDEEKTRHPAHRDDPLYQPACDCNDPSWQKVGDWRQLEDRIEKGDLQLKQQQRTMRDYYRELGEKISADITKIRPEVERRFGTRWEDIGKRLEYIERAGKYIRQLLDDEFDPCGLNKYMPTPDPPRDDDDRETGVNCPKCGAFFDAQNRPIHRGR